MASTLASTTAKPAVRRKRSTDSDSLRHSHQDPQESRSRSEIITETHLHMHSAHIGDKTPEDRSQARHQPKKEAAIETIDISSFSSSAELPQIPPSWQRTADQPVASSDGASIDSEVPQATGTSGTLPATGVVASDTSEQSRPLLEQHRFDAQVLASPVRVGPVHLEKPEVTSLERMFSTMVQERVVAALEEKQREIAELLARLAQSDRVLVEDRGQKDLVEQRLASAHQTILNQSVEIQERKADANNLRGELDVERSNANDLERSLRHLNRDLGVKEREINALKSALNNERQAAQANIASLEQKDKEIAKLVRELNALYRLSTDQQTEIGALKSELSDLEPMRRFYETWSPFVHGTNLTVGPNGYRMSGNKWTFQFGNDFNVDCVMMGQGCQKVAERL